MLEADGEGGDDPDPLGQPADQLRVPALGRRREHAVGVAPREPEQVRRLVDLVPRVEHRVVVAREARLDGTRQLARDDNSRPHHPKPFRCASACTNLYAGTGPHGHRSFRGNAMPPPRRLTTTGFPLLVAAVTAWAAVAASPAAALAAAPVDLLSYRAAYRLSLDATGPQSAGGPGLESVRGALVLEWRADCTGWLSQQRINYVARATEGEGFTQDVRFSSWEAPDYTRLRFNVRNFEDGKAGETFSGAAALSAPGANGEARYSVPAGSPPVALPPGTLFPTEHVLKLIEAARAGERILSSIVFDGSDADALNLVTAVIGDGGTAPGSGERRWPVRLAYHDASSDDALPEFEISFGLTESGVLHDIRLDYGDFALKGELEKLEPLAEPKCE
jgi:hypothetical protein